MPVVEDLDLGAQPIIDGTLLPRWSWKDRPDLCSGGHRTAGLNVQAAARREPGAEDQSSGPGARHTPARQAHTGSGAAGSVQARRVSMLTSTASPSAWMSATSGSDSTHTSVPWAVSTVYSTWSP